jgi:hypothetical protein
MVYRKIRGVEFQMELFRDLIPYYSGWFSLNFFSERFGNFGYDQFYQDSNKSPHKVSSAELKQDPRPIFKGNLNFYTPGIFGPSLSENLSVFGDINMNLTFYWQQGEQFTWNPAEKNNIENNLRWKPYARWDLHFSKGLFKLKNLTSYFYIDIMNLFNQRNMTPNNDIAGVWAWDGHPWWENEFDKYMTSLGYTPQNQNSDGSFKNTNGQPGENKGDLPAFTPWTFLGKRDVFSA